MLAHPLDPALSRFMIMRARIALDNLDQVGALGFGQRVLLRSRQEAQRVCRSPKGLRVVAIQRGVATESWSVPVGGERCNQTKCLPVALVRIIAFGYNTHTWHAFDLVDKSSPLRVDDRGRRYGRPLEPRRPPVETTARLTFWGISTRFVI